MRGRRQPLDEQRDRAVDLAVLDQVVVVEHEHDRLGQLGEVVDEERENLVGDRGSRRVKRRLR